MLNNTPRVGLDERTIRFTVKTSEELQAGDALIVRSVMPTKEGVEVSVVTEKAVRAEAEKLLVR